ncbi:btk-binding protein-related [Anaeramoeba ignava]|uniref:Btk-binding protein-related n=1 Tax=Anaeramoeba ignava TaxID=1746090 RepID=A0A9Q0LAD3_ANAIG|nr:btk-binding protein-related [Anaeramoeba ignava]
MKRKDIRIFGFNTFSKILKNSSSKIKKPIQINLKKEYQIKQIIGSDSIFVLYQNGKAEEYKTNSKKKISIRNEKIEKISTGNKIISILTNEKKVYLSGNIITKSEKQSQNEFINISKRIEDPEDQNVNDVICGAFSVYLLTSKGNVYGIGENGFGQLGNNLNDQKKQAILMMKDVSKVFTGNSSSHVFILNSKKELFGCGNNSYGQLGLDTSIQKISELTKLKNIPKGKIIDIQCGNAHSIMLISGEDGKRRVYSCGNSISNGIYNCGDINSFTLIRSPLLDNLNIDRISSGKGHIEIETDNFWLNVSNYDIGCGYETSFLHYSLISNLNEDFVNFFRNEEFSDYCFVTKDQKRIPVHDIILRYRIGSRNITNLKLLIQSKDEKEAKEILEMIYGNYDIDIDSKQEMKRYKFWKEGLNEAMKRMYYDKESKDFTIKRGNKNVLVHKLVLIARSELYRGMFLSVTEDKSNKVTDYSELSDEAFEILIYYLYTNEIKDNGFKLTKEIINELEIAMDYFQLNESVPNLVTIANELHNQKYK